MIAADEAAGERVWQWMCYVLSGCEEAAACINVGCDADVSGVAEWRLCERARDVVVLEIDKMESLR